MNSSSSGSDEEEVARRVPGEFVDFKAEGLLTNHAMSSRINESELMRSAEGKFQMGRLHFEEAKCTQYSPRRLCCRQRLHVARRRRAAERSAR